MPNPIRCTWICPSHARRCQLLLGHLEVHIAEQTGVRQSTVTCHQANSYPSQAEYQQAYFWAQFWLGGGDGRYPTLEPAFRCPCGHNYLDHSGGLTGPCSRNDCQCPAFGQYHLFQAPSAAAPLPLLDEKIYCDEEDAALLNVMLSGLEAE